MAIAYGADPDEIGFTNSALLDFTTYLKNKPTEDFKLLFNGLEEKLILRRADSLNKIYIHRTTSLWSKCINALIEFLNLLPLVNIKGHKRKTFAIAKITQQILKDEPCSDDDLGLQKYDESIFVASNKSSNKGRSLSSIFGFFSSPKTSLAPPQEPSLYDDYDSIEPINNVPMNIIPN